MPPPILKNENPYIVLLALKDDKGMQVYKAYSIADMNLHGYINALDVVFEFIRYNRQRPLETATTVGHLDKAYVRASAIPLEERDKGIKFVIRESGLVGRSIVPHDYVPEHPTQVFHSADHFTLY